MISKNLGLWITLSTLLIGTAIGGVNLVLAQQVQDLTKATGGKALGGEKIGTVTLEPNGHTVRITANMTAPPDEGKVFEGWLVDEGGSDYKLSLGELSKNGTLNFQETLVNPYTYTQFVITQEPFEDPDPNAAEAFGGTELQTPFGQ